MKNCGEFGISNAIGESALFCRYTCQVCGHDTQWRKLDTLKLFFTLKDLLRKSMAGQHFSSEEEEISVYQKAAKKELLILFRQIIAQAESGCFDALLVREKGCPACGAKQEWMKKPSKRAAEYTKPRFWPNPELGGAVMLSDFVDPGEQARLPDPFSIEIIRLTSLMGRLESLSIMLNGRNIGDLHIGTSITVQTDVRDNIVCLHTAPGGPALAAARFQATAGEKIRLRLAGTRFKQHGALLSCCSLF